MEKPFFRVVTIDETRELLRGFGTLAVEDAPAQESLYRVLAEQVKSREDVPAFDRSTMDGFAVRSTDTFGATESSPALFNVAGEVAMGEMRPLKPKRGEAVRIWTGGALPLNCDAVVMVEHTQQVDEAAIEILKAVAPLDNVVRKGEDVKKGETLLKPGHRLRPQDLGLLAALGRLKIAVYKRPTVSVISSGDEIVPVEMEPQPGCVRDVNRHTLSALIREVHAEPKWIGIAPDSLKAVRSALEQGLETGDTVLISGGSSMGSRDLVIEAITGFGDSEILLHGVSVSPGKPLILARVGSKPIFGLPGHPVSAMVCFEQFVVPLLRHIEGEAVLRPFLRPTVEAVLARNVPSKEGRTDYVRVRLQRRGSEIVAVPVLGKSGLISSMVRADGFFSITADCEGLYKGRSVTVHLFSNWTGGTIETEHIPGHETSVRGSGDILETPRQERLSGI